MPIVVKKRKDKKETNADLLARFRRATMDIVDEIKENMVYKSGAEERKEKKKRKERLQKKGGR